MWPKQKQVEEAVVHKVVKETVIELHHNSPLSRTWPNPSESLEKMRNKGCEENP